MADHPTPALEALEPTDERTLALRDPSSAVTLDELQGLRGEAVEVLEARAAIVETARRRAIRLTHPEDWVLFKAPDGRITGYLQDAGCDRVRDVLGIEVFNISPPEKIASIEGGGFMYLVRGWGRSRLTLQTVEEMEGGRASTDDFTRGATGAALELLVRKAARANLDGNVTRELTGLKAIPAGELAACWAGTSKSVEHCHKGRGFGTAEERLGAHREGAPEVEPPTCPVCKVPLVYRAGKGGRGAFYGCPKYTTHPDKRVIVDAAEWEAGAAARAAAAAPVEEPGANG